DQTLHRKIAESAGEPLEAIVSRLIGGMVEVHAADPELAALLDSEVPHRADQGKEFSLRLHEPLRKALEPYTERLVGPAKLNLPAFLFAKVLEAFGHAIVLRRPRAVSQRYA